MDQVQLQTYPYRSVCQRGLLIKRQTIITCQSQTWRYWSGRRDDKTCDRCFEKLKRDQFRGFGKRQPHDWDQRSHCTMRMSDAYLLRKCPAVVRFLSWSPSKRFPLVRVKPNMWLPTCDEGGWSKDTRIVSLIDRPPQLGNWHAHCHPYYRYSLSPTYKTGIV